MLTASPFYRGNNNKPSKQYPDKLTFDFTVLIVTQRRLRDPQMMPTTGGQRVIVKHSLVGTYTCGYNVFAYKTNSPYYRLTLTFN